MDHDDYIRTHWHTTSRRKMARALGIPMRTLHWRARRLGLTGQRPWTDDDETLLREQYGRWSVETLAEKLGRTPGAVLARAKKLRLDSVGDDLSLAMVASLIGRDVRTVAGWIERGELQAHRRGGVQRVYPARLRAFILDDKGRIMWRAVLRAGMIGDLVGLIAEEWGVAARRSSGHADAVRDE